MFASWFEYLYTAPYATPIDLITATITTTKAEPTLLEITTDTTTAAASGTALTDQMKAEPTLLGITTDTALTTTASGTDQW